MKSYLGFTGHFVLHGRLQSVMLACKRFRGRHNAQNISEAYLELATSFAIEGKVSDVITDSAANMMKAFRDFGLPGYEPAHSEDTPNNVDDGDSNDSNDSDSDDDSGDTSDPTDNGVYDFLSGHHPCFAHTLQLTVKDGLKGAGAAVNRLLAMALKLVSHVRKSTIAAEELEGETRLQTATDTPWNSQLIMIRSILSMPEQKMIATESIHPALLLTIYERSVLKELCDMLKPFEDATLYAQKENTVSSSLVVPCVRGLMRKVTALSATYNGGLMKALKAATTSRLSCFENDTFLCAAKLDPRFKLRWAHPIPCHPYGWGHAFQRIQTQFTQRGAPAQETSSRTRGMRAVWLHGGRGGRTGGRAYRCRISSPCLPEEALPSTDQRSSGLLEG